MFVSWMYFSAVCMNVCLCARQRVRKKSERACVRKRYVYIERERESER